MRGGAVMVFGIELMVWLWRLSLLRRGTPCMMHFASGGWKLDCRVSQGEGKSRDPQGASGWQDGGTRGPTSRGLQGMEERWQRVEIRFCVTEIFRESQST